MDMSKFTPVSASRFAAITQQINVVHDKNHGRYVGKNSGSVVAVILGSNPNTVFVIRNLVHV